MGNWGTTFYFMKFKSFLAAFALLACGSVSAQNATKADLSKLENQVNALYQKVAQLETNLERVISENVNLVEQLNVKTVTSCTDKNGIQWDIVKVEPVEANVVVTLRITNNSGAQRNISVDHVHDLSFAVDTNSNLANNKYFYRTGIYDVIVPNGSPINVQLTLKNVPLVTSYLSIFQFMYYDKAVNEKNIMVKFSGVHVPR